MRPIIIDCVKNIDGYLIAQHPNYRQYAKVGAPQLIGVYYDRQKVPELKTIQWKMFVKWLLNRSKIIPCTVKHPVTGHVYYKFRKGDR